MKILVTGATGFIGKHLLPLLSPEDEIHVLVRDKYTIFDGGGHLNLQSIGGDLREPREAFRRLEEIRPDICLHLAWTGIPDFSLGICHENLFSGIRLFQHLVERCECKKIISIGSCFEYGTIGAQTEHQETNLISSFAWSKHSLMDLGFMLSNTRDLKFLWPRLFYVYGIGQRKESLIPTLVSDLRMGKSPVIKTPHNCIDLIHVTDVAKAIKKMLNPLVPTGIYNIGSGEETPIWKVIEYVEAELGLDNSVSHYLYVSGSRASHNSYANRRLAHEFLDWEPTISLKEGIRDYIQNTP